MPAYFAYGSNCNHQIMQKKGVAYVSRTRASLTGYRLRFNKRSLRERLPEAIGFANIERDPDHVVEGILYEIDEDHLQRLDESERYPDHYDRIEVTVTTDGGHHECWAYQAQPGKTADGLVPSRNYLNHILAGRDFLSRQYFEALDRSLTYNAACGSCQRTSEVVFVDERGTLHALCQPCNESRTTWGDVRGRRLTVSETSSVMTQLVIDGPGFDSIGELVQTAIRQGLIEP